MGTIGFWSYWLIMEPARKALLHSMNFFNRYLPGGWRCDYSTHHSHPDPLLAVNA